MPAAEHIRLAVMHRVSCMKRRVIRHISSRPHGFPSQQKAEFRLRCDNETLGTPQTGFRRLHNRRLWERIHSGEAYSVLTKIDIRKTEPVCLHQSALSAHWHSEPLFSPGKTEISLTATSGQNHGWLVLGCWCRLFACMRRIWGTVR